MKRTFVLLLIFLALVGGGILALTVSSGDGGKKIELADASGADAIEARIIHEWSIAAGWDKDLYRDFKEEIQMNRSADLITTAQEDQLLQLNCARASLVIVPLAEKEFKKPDCNRSVIAKCSDGISTLNKDGFSNAETKKIGSCCSVYFQILKMIDSTCPSEFRANGEKTEWKDYRDYVTEQEQAVQSFLSNETYRSRLSHITDLKNGLANRMPAVREAAGNYYSGVLREIKAYFDAHSGINPAVLSSAAGRFRQQASSFPGCSSLTEELDRYAAAYQ